LYQVSYKTQALIFHKGAHSVLCYSLYSYMFSCNWRKYLNSG